MNPRDLINLQEAYLDVYYDLDEGMKMKDFKSNRRKLQRKAAEEDAIRRGHVGKTWADPDTYSTDEARVRRSRLTDYVRQANYRSAIDPDNDNENYPAIKTKNPKKLRKQKAMGELKDHVELYDTILSHLLDEGYADTIEEAEVIVENMSDEWLDDILEGRSENIRNKMIARYGKPEEGDSLRLHVARTKYTTAASRYQDGYGPHPDMGPEGKLTKGQMMYKAGRANRRKIK